MTQWGMDVKAAGFFRAIGVLLVGAGLVAIVAATVGSNGALRYSAFTMFMLGLHALALSEYKRRTAKLQAAIDMKRFAFDAMAKTPLVVQEVVVRLDGGDSRLRARDGTEFKIQLKGIAPDHASLRVEYLG